jgi:hypothetical protein
MSPTRVKKTKFDGADILTIVAAIESCAEFAVLDLHSRALITACFGWGERY